MDYQFKYDLFFYVLSWMIDLNMIFSFMCCYGLSICIYITYFELRLVKC